MQKTAWTYELLPMGEFEKLMEGIEVEGIQHYDFSKITFPYKYNQYYNFPKLTLDNFGLTAHMLEFETSFKSLKINEMPLSHFVKPEEKGLLRCEKPSMAIYGENKDMASWGLHHNYVLYNNIRRINDFLQNSELNSIDYFLKVTEKVKGNFSYWNHLEVDLPPNILSYDNQKWRNFKNNFNESIANYLEFQKIKRFYEECSKFRNVWILIHKDYGL